jgi:hypothetical protein
MPSALAICPLPGCVASRFAEATFCGISPIEASTVFLFSVAHDRQLKLAADRFEGDKAWEVVPKFYFVTACSGDHVPCLRPARAAGLSGVSEATSARVGLSESSPRLLAIAGVTF